MTKEMLEELKNMDQAKLEELQSEVQNLLNRIKKLNSTLNDEKGENKND